MKKPFYCVAEYHSPGSGRDESHHARVHCIKRQSMLLRKRNPVTKSNGTNPIKDVESLFLSNTIPYRTYF